MKRERKVYDFSLKRVKTKLVSVLKRGTDGATRGSTLADLVAATGLPHFQVQQAIKHVCDEYRGHLRVTESGEILYYFPYGMKSTQRGFVPGAKRFFGRLITAAAALFSLLFKVWIMLMLVGYFLLFLALLLVALLASVVVIVGGGRREGRSRGGGLFTFYFFIRIFELFTWIWLYSGAGRYRGTREKKKPLHRSVFAYVFGDGDPTEDWEGTQKRAVISALRGMKGVITLEELMVLTGLNPIDAQQYMNRLLLEQEGEPSVTDDGTLIYLFPSLLGSGRERSDAGAEGLPLLRAPRRKPVAFNANEPRTNRWITFFNGFNLLFGFYFFYFAMTNPEPVMEIVRGVQRFQIDLSFLYHYLSGLLYSLNIEPAVMIIFIALGIVPLVFSFLFFLTPSFLKAKNRKRNESIELENLRKSAYLHILSNPDGVQAQETLSTHMQDPSASPLESERSQRADRVLTGILDEFAAFKAGNIEEKEDGTHVYSFPELERELADLQEYRSSVDLKQFDLGDTVFDSGEDQ